MSVVILHCFSIAAQNNWINYTGWGTNTILDNGSSLWICGPGLCRFDKATGNTSIWNKANSPLDYSNSTGALASDGSVWMINNFGRELIRFDGNSTWNSFDNTDFGFTPGYDDIKYITASPGGAIAFAGDIDIGLCIYNGSVWTLYPLNSGPLSGEIDGIGYDSQGNLWVLTAQDLLRFDGTSWTTVNFPSAGYFSSFFREKLYIDRNDNIWVTNMPSGLGDRVLARFDGTNWTGFTSSLITTNSAYPHISSIETDSGNNTWVVSSLAHVWKYDGNSWTDLGMIQNYTMSYLGDLASDNTGNIWFGGNNVVKINSTGFVPYPDISGSLIAGVTVIASRQNNYIFGYGSGNMQGMYGLSVKTPNSWWDNLFFQNFAGSSFPEWIPGYVTAIAFNDTNEVYVKSQFGLLCYRNGLWDTTSCPDIDYAGSRLCAKNNGELLVSYNNEMQRLVAQNWTVYTPANIGFNVTRFNQITEDANGISWMGSARGLVRFDGTGWQLFGLPDSNIVDLAPDAHGGIACMSQTDSIGAYVIGIGYPVGSKRILYRYFQNTFTALDSAFLNYWQPPSGHIPVSLVEADGLGNIYYNLDDSGLKRYDLNSGNTQVFTPANSGLPYLNISDLHVDAYQNVWIASGGVLAFYGSGIPGSSSSPEVNFSGELLIYPSPATDRITVSTGWQPGSVCEIQITNATGQLVYRGSTIMNNPEIDISAFPAGIYYCTLTDPATRSLAGHGKFIRIKQD